MTTSSTSKPTASASDFGFPPFLRGSMLFRMLGTIFNSIGILAGATWGLLRPRQLTTAAQNYLKLALGCVTMFFGLKLTWVGLNGSFWRVIAQFTIALLALMLGRILGRLLHLQKLSNQLGRQAREDISLSADKKPAWSDGFYTCSMLFCAAPLAVLGAVADGLGNHFAPLLVKAVMDGLAAYGFAAIFGWSVALSAIPVFVYQGTLTLLCIQYARPFLEQRGLLDSVVTTDGLLVVFVALVVLEVRKIELADYLPSLALAPLLTWLWR